MNQHTLGISRAPGETENFPSARVLTPDRTATVTHDSLVGLSAFTFFEVFLMLLMDRNFLAAAAVAI
jgi:hypothetical protein